MYLDAQSRSPKKLGFKTQGPYTVLQTDGSRFLIESLRGIRKVSSDHVTGHPTPSARDAEWTCALRAQALFKKGTELMDGPEFVIEKFIKHGWNDDGQLKLLVSGSGFPKRKPCGNLPLPSREKHSGTTVSGRN